jgi:hypothetical protein
MQISRAPFSCQADTLEVQLKWNEWVRQTHRWVSVAFTLGFFANLIAAARKTYAMWVGLTALLPLLFLLVTGLYLFALPYAARWRRGRAS